MHIATDTPILGIEDRVLRWNASEAKCLARAAAILDQAREFVGPDSPTGTELGKAYVILADASAADLIIDQRIVPAEEWLA